MTSPNFLYNETYKLESSIETQWLDWVKNKVVPSVVKSRIFTSVKVNKLLYHDEPGSSTYAIQYESSDLLSIQKYQSIYSKVIHPEIDKLFKEKYVVFRSVMEVVSSEKIT